MTVEPYIDALLRTLEAKRWDVVLISRDTAWRADDVLCSIYRYARTLRSQGVEAGKLVALWAPNRAEALAIRYAANLLGAATCFLSAPPAPEARTELLRQMAPDLLVIFPETVHLMPATPGVEVFAAGETGCDLFRLDKIAAMSPPEPIASAARPDDLAIIVSSGGSTGVPKGSCRDFATYSPLAVTADKPLRRQLVNGKLAYLSQVLVDQTLTGGGCVVLRDHFDPADTLAQIARHAITDLFLVEPQLFELMDHPDLSSARFASLQRLVHIGASAPASLRRRAHDRFGPVLVHTYGASEEGLVSMLGPDEYAADPDAFTSAGKILPGVELRLRRHDGSLADVGETGTIEVRSAATAKGYQNQPERTASAFVDGWYHSGDLGQFDALGRLHVLGRSDDIVEVGTLAVSPTVIEELLCREPSVRFAIAVRDAARDRWVVLAQPWTGSLDRKHCLRIIASHLGQVTANATTLIESAVVPLTEQGKPDRVAILRMATDLRS